MEGHKQFGKLGTLHFVLLILTMGATQLLAQTGELCDWQRDDPHKMHWPQLPDLSPTGMDVSLGRAILADDFKCTATGPIRDIHIWGSFLNDVFPDAGPDGLTLELRIYTDVPATATTWSRPGDLKWRRAFKPGEYTSRRVHNGPEGWYDPVSDVYLPANHRYAFQYNFCIEEEPFVQEEGQVYWLAVKDLSADDTYTFGWKTTSVQLRWNDDAAYLLAEGTPWIEMNYPKKHKYEGETLDLAFVITNGRTPPERDLGDAPDSSNSVAGAAMLAYPAVAANYPTVYLAGSPPHGPLHLLPRDMYYLGKWVTLENEADLGPDEDGMNNLDPLTDAANRDGADDGLVRPVALPFCERTTLDYIVTVTSLVPTSAYVNVWCDWNRDGDWDDTLVCPDGDLVPEWAVQNDNPAFPGAGVYVLTSSPFQCWHPTSTGLDPIWVRITIAERPWTLPTSGGGSGGMGPAGGYKYGETEDYHIRPQNEPVPAKYDWGDAPDGHLVPGYPTLAANNGARHIIAGPWLGDAAGQPDSESDGQPHANALGDDLSGSDDENGVSIPPLIPGLTASATVEVGGGGGVVQLWIDFDADTVWEAAEKVFDGFLPDGVHVLPFGVPAAATTGRTFARARISTSGGLAPDGSARDGEVEDHEARIVARPVEVEKTWCQWPDLTPHGIDIRMDNSDNRSRALADDFECTSFGERLTHIRFWGSWKDDHKGVLRRLRVRIHPDDPVGPEGSDKTNDYSKPGPEILWEKVFLAGQFREELYHVVRITGEWWWDPVAGDALPGGDTQVWQIDLDVDPDEAFVQEGTPGKPRIYWLALEAETVDGQFGWKTREWPEHFMDDAVWDVSPTLPRTWHELRYPPGHRYHEVEQNSIDLSFCLLFSGEAPPATVLPGAVTACPPAATTCPALLTTCPAVETQCPSAETQCPAVATRCPPAATRCPAFVTRCPPVETECPGSVTQCPPVLTGCPPLPTRCQVIATECPAQETRCPAVETFCPPLETQCPSFRTQCPTFETRCPLSQTRCPPVETECPPVLTECPPLRTRCPAVATECPATETRCPPVQTECPPLLTRCPPTATLCQVVRTQCPVCVPITAQVATGGDTRSPMFGSLCPIVETDCPTIGEYLVAAAR